MKLLLATACLVPALILVHELAHLFTAISFGVPDPKLSMARFTHAPAPWLQSWQIASIAGAGPIATFALAIAGAAFPRPRRALLAAAVSAAACARLLELLPYGLSALMRRLRDSPPRATTFDEDIAFRALGLPGDVGLLVAAAILAAVVCVLALRHRHDAISLGLGTILGWVAWTAIVRL